MKKHLTLKTLLYVFLTRVSGTIIDVQIFTRDGVEKDARALEIEEMQLSKLRKI